MVTRAAIHDEPDLFERLVASERIPPFWANLSDAARAAEARQRRLTNLARLTAQLLGMRGWRYAMDASLLAFLAGQGAVVVAAQALVVARTHHGDLVFHLTEAEDALVLTWQCPACRCRLRVGPVRQLHDAGAALRAHLAACPGQ